MAHIVNELMDSSMQNLRDLVDVNTIIGDPIEVGNVTIIPISKVSFGFVTAGSDIPSQKAGQPFGGGNGSGVTINPLAFLVINNGEVQLLQMATSNNTADKIVNMVPEVMDKVSALIKKDGKSKAQQVEIVDEVKVENN